MKDLSDPATPARRVALLVDGENLSCTHAGALIMRSARYGSLIVKRVYGNVGVLNGWSAAPGFRIVHAGAGKNATDLLLVVEAMALMLGGMADVLIIASSDGDFTHLAAHLCEHGHTVIGTGTQTAPERFRKSCTTFHELAPGGGASVAPSGAADPLTLLTRALLAEHPEGLPITALSSQMKDRHQVRIGATPFKTWRGFLTARPDLFACDPKGPEARVRLAAG